MIGHSRKCPRCGDDIYHKSRYTRNQFHKMKRTCRKCANDNRRALGVPHLHSKENYRKLSLALVGVKATGKNAAGENNLRAISGYFRDPQGKLHKFKNVAQFIRDNPEMFNEEDVIWWRPAWAKPGSRIRKCRAHYGLLSITGKNRARTCWKGWTIGSMTESICTQGADLLDRRSS